MGVIPQAFESCGFAMSRMEEMQTTEKVYNLYLR